MKHTGRSFDESCAAALGGTIIVATLLFLLLPPAIVLLLSFSNESQMIFPPRTWGLRQYHALASSQYWLGAIWMSVKIAVPVSIIATVIAAGAGLAIHRSRLPGREVLTLAGVMPLIVPISAYAVALYGLYASLGLIATYEGIVLANVVLAVPQSLILLDYTLGSLSPELELVAMTLGASRRQAWQSITLRLLVPAVSASIIFAFLTSFDEAVVINFLGGGVFTTLPKAIFDSVRFGVDPLISAIATILIAATAILSAATIASRRRSESP